MDFPEPMGPTVFDIIILLMGCQVILTTGILVAIGYVIFKKKGY